MVTSSSSLIESLIRRAAAEDEDAIDELCATADTDPRRLTAHHGLLLDLEVWWPGKLYRTAGADVVRRVIEQIDSGRTPDRLHHLLLVLAHSAHPLAESAMRGWSTRPPPGVDALPVEPLRYAQEGGWVVDPAGNRRELCGETAYAWVMRETSRRAEPHCPWCASPLWTAADLDTADPAVGAALGTADWWAGNTRPSYLPDPAGPETPPALLPTLGPALPNPYQASAWNRGGSTLGGRPDWIQDAEHAGCPGCEHPMDYVGLIGGADLDEFGEGAYYLHLHLPCGFAAVSYQQS